MSTTAPPPSGQVERAHGRIRHPLDRLRKYINAYVFVEAVGLIALVVALAFWAGFWLDYGTFKTSAAAGASFDWVQLPGSFWMRLFILSVFVLFMLALVGFVVATRFFKEFRDSALALVLERRFPGVLGDRLITAVELHNPKQAAKYGYSPQLVEQTIHEAADRVEQVPVGQVFAWKRLYTYGLVLVYLSVGLYLLTGAGFCAHRAALNRKIDEEAEKGKFEEAKQPVLTGFSDFNDAAVIWAERNLLLRNVIWPRNSHIELLPLYPAPLKIPRTVTEELAEKFGEADRDGDGKVTKAEFATFVSANPWFQKYPMSTDRAFTQLDLDQDETLTRAEFTKLAELGEKEARIARDQTPPTLRARAWRYVLADRKAEEGWRLLTWEDVKENPRLFGGTVPAMAEAVWTPRDPDVGLSVDEIELKLESFPVRKDKLANSDGSSVKYCTLEADGKTWRALTWADLSQERLGGLRVPPLPASWDPAAGAVGVIGMGPFGGLPMAARAAAGTEMQSLAVDEVLKRTADAEAKLNEIADKDKTSVDRNREADLTQIRRAIAHLDHLVEVRDAVDAIESKATDRSLRRVVRRLRVPAEATLVFYGRKTLNQNTMTRVANNEFTGEFRGLKESVTYVVRGDDYTTPARELRIVDKPRLEKLESEEERPAYLYYRPSDPWKPSELRGRRQKFAPISVTLSGQATTIEVPVGTVLTLTGTSSKPLKKVTIAEQERLRQMLGQMRPTVAALLTWVEAKQPELKAQPFFEALARTQAVIGKTEDVKDVPAIVKGLSASEAVSDLDLLTQQLQYVADRLGAAGDLLATFDKANDADPANVEFVKHVKTLKDVRELLKGRVLERLAEPKLLNTSEMRTFTLAVETMGRDPQKFTFEFEDTDGVRDERAVVIQPRDDVAPTIREFNPDDVVRRGKEGFIVSANARIPFKGRVRDDHGLSRVRYACKVTPADFISEQQYLKFNGIGAILPLGRPETRLHAMMYLALVNRSIANTTNEEGSDEQFIELPAFDEQVTASRLKDGRNELLDAETVTNLLATPQKDTLFRRLTLDFALVPDKWLDADSEKGRNPRKWLSAQDVAAIVDDERPARLLCDLPLWQLKYRGEPLKERDEAKAQKRYQVEIRLLAEDVNAEGLEMLPTILFDNRREEDRLKLRERVDKLRPFIGKAVGELPKDQRNKKDLHPLEAALNLIGTSATALDLMTIGKNLISPEGEKLLSQVTVLLGKNEQVPVLLNEIRALLKDREPLPHVRPSSETFTFMVVPGNELMGKIGEEEEAKQRDLIKQMKPLRLASSRLGDAQTELNRPKPTEAVLTGAIAHCDTVDDTLKSALGDMIAVRNAYDRIIREYRLNQLDPGQTRKLFEEVAKPLANIVDRQFEVTLAEVRSLRRAVDNKEATVEGRAQQAVPRAKKAQDELNKLISDLQDVIDKMKGLTEFSDLVKAIQEILDEEERIEKTIKGVYQEAVRKALGLPPK